MRNLLQDSSFVQMAFPSGCARSALALCAIVAEIRQLKTAKLLGGFRGAPPADVAAVARVVAAIGQLMRNVPEIVEIDVNPLVAHAQGVTALDALIVTA